MKDSEWGRQGAKKRWSKTTPEERKAFCAMIRAAKAKKRAKKAPKTKGKLSTS